MVLSINDIQSLGENVTTVVLTVDLQQGLFQNFEGQQETTATTTTTTMAAASAATTTTAME